MRAYEENIVTTARDADIGSIFGWGFAPWSGGIFSYIDTLSIDTFIEECDDFAQGFGPMFEVPKLLRDMAKEGKSFY